MFKLMPMLGRMAAALLLVVPSVTSTTAHADQYAPRGPACDHGSPLCPDLADSKDVLGHYTGHDEPSLLFYSNTPGSGNSFRSSLRLPKDPPVMPNAQGTGGTWNFQLHPAFWYGMALCDNQSAPLPSNQPCRADSDSNIFTSLDTNTPTYIGKHPGTAFLEVQFYPPGWVPWPASQIINGGSSCDATKWCAAVLVFSLQRNYNQPVAVRGNNPDCVAKTGVESFNFAFLTRNGRPTGPPDPLNQTTSGTFTPDPKRDLFMNSGDVVSVDLHDTPSGLKVSMEDQNTGQQGSMVMGPANGFAQVVFDQNQNATCTEKPYAFHPMYSTSSENTRVPWAAHSYNVAFSDEIGHFEYCPKVDQFAGVCVSPTSASDPGGIDGDDQDGNCAPASDSTLVKIDGCTGTDDDFDGPEYSATWAGTGTPAVDRMTKPEPIQFTSPVFNRGSNYSRVAFEADLAAIESSCSTVTGIGCTNPPQGTHFYPIYTTAQADRDNLQGCIWQFGGPAIPGTTNTFGGNSVTEFGSAPFALDYPRATGPVKRFEDFRTILPNNPCPSENNQGQQD